MAMLVLTVLAVMVDVCNAGTPYNTSGLMSESEMGVDRGFANWPLQVSLAARIAAAPGLVVAMQCEWEFWRHRSLDSVGMHPVLCLSRHCGLLRIQKAALRPFRPAWAFHCMHPPNQQWPDGDNDGPGGAAGGSKANRSNAGKTKPAAATTTPPSPSSSQQQQQQSKNNTHQAPPPKSPKQALSGLSNEEVEAFIANATMLVVGIPSGGGLKIQPPVMASMVRQMPKLQQVDVVVASERGRQLVQLAAIEAPRRKAKILYAPSNR